MDKTKAIEILEQSKIRAEWHINFYAPKDDLVAQLWRDKASAYELARRALLKETDYDKKLYEVD